MHTGRDNIPVWIWFHETASHVSEEEINNHIIATTHNTTINKDTISKETVIATKKEVLI